VFAGKYRVERELGDVAAGRTFVAIDPKGDRVIVKLVHPASAEAAREIESDVATISGIRHPALPMVHEWGHDGSDFFVVRDYVPGADLELELGQQERFAPMTAARYGAEAASALGQIHARGLVHGNVKTANLIRTPEDEIVLVGNSLGVGGPRLSSATTAEAARYLAPEQVEGGGVTPASDVYAMGVVLYELVTGHVPFDGTSAAAIADLHAHAVPQPLSEQVEDVPVALEAVVMKALEKSPDQRYADGEALRAALAAVGAPALEQVAAPGAPIPPKRRSMWPWILGLLALLLAALGLAWALGAFAPAKPAVPDVVGQTQTSAASALATIGLKVGTVTFAGTSVAGIADGSVSAQNPAPGVIVDPGSAVNLVLGGVEAVNVPDVVGVAETQAKSALEAAGLLEGTVTNVSTTTVASGIVVAQFPTAGTSVGKGTSIDLQVAQDVVAVPDVTNETQSNAQEVLSTAGLVSKVVKHASASVPVGSVISQNPVAGATVKIGSTVTMTVSTGPGLVTVPDVGGLMQADAVNALTAAGFKSQIALHTGGGTVGTVIAQSPVAGAKAATGSTVVITVVQ
jgi:serine/threonine-protein kinase